MSNHFIKFSLELVFCIYLKLHSDNLDDLIMQYFSIRLLLVFFLFSHSYKKINLIKDKTLFYHPSRVHSEPMKYMKNSIAHNTLALVTITPPLMQYTPAGPPSYPSHFCSGCLVIFPKCVSIKK
jgi:hypothetical protein